MKKSLAILVAVMAMALTSQAQEKQQGYYESQYAKLYKNYVKKPDNVVNLLAMAEFYANAENPMYNLPLAMKYICAAEENYVAIIEDEKRYAEAKEAIKKGVTVTSVRNQKQFVLMSARQYIKDHTSITNAELDNFALAFAKDPSTMRLVEAQRMRSNFVTTRQTNTIESYLWFAQSYPGTSEAEEAMNCVAQKAADLFKSATTEEDVDRRLEPYKDIASVVRVAVRQKAHIAFLAAEKRNDVKSYRDYMVLYPSGDDYGTALERVAQLLEGQYEKMTTPEELADFVQHNGDNPLADQAMERLVRMITENHDAKAMRLYLDKFPLDPSYNDIYRLYYEWVSGEGDVQPIRDFVQENPNFPFQAAIQHDLTLDGLVGELDLMAPYVESRFQDYVSHVRKLTGKGRAFVALQRMLQLLIARQDWKGVNERMDYVMLSFDEYDVDRYQELRSIVNAKSDPMKQTVTEVAPSYNMRHPQLHPDGQHLYYTKGMGATSTISFAEAAQGRSYKWKSVGDVVFTNATNQGLEFFCLYDEGRKMLLGRNGDILAAYKNGANWTIDDAFAAGVNTPSIETDAFMLPDGSGMLLASDRRYGHNYHRSGTPYHGDTAMALDIYFVPKVGDGWGEAVNLGINVNGGFCDRSPVLSRDMKTLYYVTDARGLGYCDVYMATRSDISDWTGWSKPVNLGKEVNSGFREESVSISSDDKRLFISSNRVANRFGCFSTNTQHSEGSALRSVMVDGSELGSTVKSLGVVDLTAQSQIRTIDLNGSVSELMKLYADHEYAVYAETEDLWVPGMRFEPLGVSIVKPQGYSAIQLVELDAIPLYLVRFEPDGSNPTRACAEEIARLGRFLQANQQVRVEVSVNVPGSDAQGCYDLSLERGRLIKKMLVETGATLRQVSVSPFGNYYAGGRDAGVADVEIRIRNI